AASRRSSRSLSARNRLNSFAALGISHWTRIDPPPASTPETQALPISGQTSSNMTPDPSIAGPRRAHNRAEKRKAPSVSGGALETFYLRRLLSANKPP